MSPILLLLLVIPLVFIALAILARRSTGGAATALRLLTTLAALPMLLFFVFGFMATFEPVANAILFRVIYIALFVSVSITVVFAWRPLRALNIGPARQGDAE